MVWEKFMFVLAKVFLRIFSQWFSKRHAMRPAAFYPPARAIGHKNGAQKNAPRHGGALCTHLALI
jgi:hypothetical protein